MAVSADEIERQKQAAAEAAVGEVRDGMLVGLGTGSTAAFAIAALGRRVTEGLSIAAVATSDRTARAAAAAGIPIRDLADIAEIDVAIDGVDEIDPQFRAIKGAGGAMLREKVVAVAARRMIAIADSSKTVETLGAHPVPVEVLAVARSVVAAAVSRLGGEAVLRLATGETALTDQGNIILDCRFATIAAPEKLAASLDAIPGLLGHGLFIDEIDTLFVGGSDDVIRSEKRLT